MTDKKFKVRQTSKPNPFFGLIYGPGGCGKTGLSTYAPNPFYIPTENGTLFFEREGFSMNGNCFEEMPVSFAETMDMFRYAIMQRGKDLPEFDTIIIDNLTFLEPLIYADIIKQNPVIERKGKPPLKVESISDYDFGRGYEKAMAYFEKIVNGSFAANRRGINVLLVAHSHIKNEEDINSGEPFKKVDINLQSWGNFKVPELFYQSCSFVYYMESVAKTKKIRGQMGNEKRIALSGSIPDITIYTRSNSRFFAKIRAKDASRVPDFYEVEADEIDAGFQKVFDDLK